jgi:hypothetical protein
LEPPGPPTATGIVAFVVVVVVGTVVVGGCVVVVGGADVVVGSVVAVVDPAAAVDGWIVVVVVVPWAGRVGGAGVDEHPAVVATASRARTPATTANGLVRRGLWMRDPWAA